MSEDARSPAARTWSSSSRAGASSGSESWARVAALRMTVRMLLKSWAMPPASRPTVSSFCDWRSWASISRPRRDVAVDAQHRVDGAAGAADRDEARLEVPDALRRREVELEAGGDAGLEDRARCVVEHPGNGGREAEFVECVADHRAEAVPGELVGAAVGEAIAQVAIDDGDDVRQALGEGRSRAARPGRGAPARGALARARRGRWRRPR